MPGRVEGKVAFITGAARGQGRSHAVRLAQEGADIIAVDVCKPIFGSSAPPSSPKDLAETADLVKGHNRRIVTAEVDVRDYAALQAAVGNAVEQLGRLDIIVANAGIANSDSGGLAESTEENWQAILDVNVGGTWKSVKAGVPHLLAGGRGGSIILTCSVAGLKPYPGMGQYVVTKHAMVGLMRAFAVELGQHMIRVNSVHPSHTNTPMVMNEATYRTFRPDLENPGQADIAPISQTFHTLPVPWVEPEDVTNAVLYLASDESRYVTGVTLPVDAGSLLK